MSDNHEIAHRLLTERKAVETLYQAFSLQQPDLVNEAVTADWADIPLAPGQARTGRTQAYHCYVCRGVPGCSHRYS
jgi:hypothetical protein